MSRDDLQRTPDEQRALDALRGLPAPSRHANWIVPLAAAAMLAMAVFGIWQFATGPTAHWRVTDVVEAGGVSGAPSEGFVLEYGRIATGPGTELELQLGNQLRLRLLPGTELELPAPPSRWRPEQMEFVLHAGEVFGLGEGLDAPVRIVAANSKTLVRGTTFAVFQTPDASCTCLWEGSVEIINRADGSVHILEPGHRYLVYNDGTTPGPQPLEAMETMKLQMIHEQGLLPDPTDLR